MKVLKVLAIAAVIVVCLGALLTIKGSVGSGKRIHKTYFFEDTASWAKSGLEGCLIDRNSSSIMFPGEIDNSRLTTSLINPGFEFTTLLISWNVEKLPPKSGMLFYANVSSDGKQWHKFHYQTYGAPDSAILGRMKLPPEKIEGIGHIATDILELDKPMKFAKIIVYSIDPDTATAVYLRRLTACFATDNASWQEYGKFTAVDKLENTGEQKLSVPYYTQRNLPEDLSGNCCSPTSVSMVLNFHEKNVDPVEFARSVYDPYHDMYGNWPYNIQAAYLAGMSKTWAEIHSGFDEIYQEVLDGKPVVISISYGYDELPESPIHSAEVGHLIAIVGFKGNDLVISNDPAGHNPEDGIIYYPKKELERVWVNHGGVAYHLWP